MKRFSELCGQVVHVNSLRQFVYEGFPLSNINSHNYKCPVICPTVMLTFCVCPVCIVES